MAKTLQRRGIGARTDRWDARLRGRQPRDVGGIYEGIVGWDDGDTHVDIGDPDVNDGNTLVKVRLIDGPSADADKNRVQCRLSRSAWFVPKEGTTVTVAMPAGLRTMPGAGVIIAVLGPSPKTLPALKATEEPIMLGPGANFIRLKKDGSISLFTTDDNTENGKSVFLQMRPDGFVLNHPQVKVTLDKNGVHIQHSSGARLDMGAVSGLPAPLDSLGSYAKLSGSMLKLECSTASIGPKGSTQDNIAKVTPILEVFSALGDFVTELLTALATGANGGGTVVFADMTLPTFTNAVAALGAALGTAALEAPSQSATVS